MIFHKLSFIIMVYFDVIRNCFSCSFLFDYQNHMYFPLSKNPFFPLLPFSFSISGDPLARLTSLTSFLLSLPLLEDLTICSAVYCFLSFLALAPDGDGSLLVVLVTLGNLVDFFTLVGQH